MTAKPLNSFLPNQIYHRYWVWIAGGVVALGYATLAAMSRDYADVGLWPVLFVCVVSSLVSMLLAGFAAKDKLDLTLFDVLIFALLFRVIACLGYPLLEDDHFRYMWDGWVFLTFGNPYDVAPAQFFGDERVPESLMDVLDGINYPQVATVYGPAAQWVFALSAWVAPAQVWPLQVVAGLADLVVIGCLARWSKPCWLILYAWSGLMIKEYAFTAHIDVIGAACMCVAIVVGQKFETNDANTTQKVRDKVVFSVLLGVLCALAVGIKLYWLLALPFVLQRNWLAWVCLMVSATAVAWPFGVMSSWLPQGLSAMGDGWLFNAPLYFAAGALFGLSGLAAAKLLFGGLFIGLCLLVGLQVLVLQPTLGWRKSLLNWFSAPTVPMQQGAPWLCALFGALLVVSPVLNPWYLVALLVFAVPFGNNRLWITPWVASIAVMASYITGLNTGDLNLQLYELKPWALWLEVILIAIAFVFDWRRHFKRGPRNL